MGTKAVYGGRYKSRLPFGVKATLAAHHHSLLRPLCTTMFNENLANNKLYCLYPHFNVVSREKSSVTLFFVLLLISKCLLTLIKATSAT